MFSRPPTNHSLVIVLFLVVPRKATATATATAESGFLLKLSVCLFFWHRHLDGLVLGSVCPFPMSKMSIVLQLAEVLIPRRMRT